MYFRYFEDIYFDISGDFILHLEKWHGYIDIARPELGFKEFDLALWKSQLDEYGYVVCYYEMWLYRVAEFKLNIVEPIYLWLWTIFDIVDL